MKKMEPRTWRTEEIVPFRLDRKGQAYYLPLTMLEEIVWKNSKTTRLKLVGKLPGCKPLRDFKVGDRLFLLNKTCGDSAEFIKEDTVMKIDFIQKIEWSIPGLCPLSPEYETEAVMLVTFSGELEFCDD